ncbi:MAG TPA: TonB-dependent receptor plug domain-containing protein, partial [Steroidobacteraceae bacterium]
MKEIALHRTASVMARVCLFAGVLSSAAIYAAAAEQAPPGNTDSNQTPTAPSNQTEPVQEVVVGGERDSGEQSGVVKGTRDVVSHDDLARYGDNSLTDALQRIPSITVDGIPGRGGEIKLRGLGNGYTQLLLNGEPVPANFSLD